MRFSSSSLRNRKSSTPAARRPLLETLEDRQLFSTLTVTSLQDSGAGSLRATVAAAQSGDTIVFASTLSTSSTLLTSATLSSSPAKSSAPKKDHGKPTPPPPPAPPPVPTITLSSGELLVTKNLTIQGPGAGKLVISGNNVFRAFDLAQGTTVNLSGLTINGSSSYWTSYPVVSPWAGYGGGILNHGSLTVNACTVGGTVIGTYAQGGGIFNDGSLNVSGCTFSGGFANGSDAADTGASGGAIANWGTATLTNSVISNNSATVDATLSYPWFNKGGGIFNQGAMTLTGCTVSGNYSRRDGGGIFNDYTGTLTLSGCTVSNNSAANGCGIYNSGTVTVKNSSSITGNAFQDVDNVGLLRQDSTSTIGILYGNTAILI
jgi:hypothetical protein